MEYSFQRKKDGSLVKTSMDELEFREVAEAEGISLPEDDSSTGYMRAIIVKSKIDEKSRNLNRKFWLKIAGSVVSVLTASGVGYVKLVPDAPVAVTAEEMEENAAAVSKKDRKQTKINTKQIEKLGGIVVEMQEVQVDSTNYIVDTINAERGEVIKVPKSFERQQTTVQGRKKQAAAGKLLELTDDEMAELAAEIDAESK